MSRSISNVVELHPSSAGSQPKVRKATKVDPHQWKAKFQGTLGLYSEDPEQMKRLAKELQRGVNSRAWTHFLDRRGKPFTEFNNFCRHPAPEGLGVEPEEVRQLLEQLFGERRAKLLTVSASRQGRRTSPPGAEKLRNDERLRAILRAPEEIQDLVVAGLLSEKEGQRFGVIAPPSDLRKEIKAICRKAPKWLSTIETVPSRKNEIRGLVRRAASGIFEARAPSETIYSALVGSNADLFPHILKVHVPEGARVIDVTYGRGIFWKHVPKGSYALTRCDIQSGTDLRKLPFDDGSYEALVLDPPYSCKSDSYSKISQDHEERYGNVARSTRGHQAILDLYVAGAKEAHRVLTMDGVLIAKTQGEVTDGKQFLTHYEIFETYRKLGWHLHDEFVLVQDGKLPLSSTVIRQYHARKNHSLFLIFRKSNKRR